LMKAPAGPAKQQMPVEGHPLQFSEGFIELARRQLGGGLASEDQDLQDALVPAHVDFLDTARGSPNQCLSKHSRSSKRARCSRTRRLVGLRASVRTTSFSSRPSSSRSTKTVAKVWGSRRKQASNTCQNSRSSRASTGDFQEGSRFFQK